RVSWTTSFRTRTASSSSPLCTAAEGPSPGLGTLRGENEAIRHPLGPCFQVSLSPLPAFFPALSPKLPPGREKRPGAKNEPFSSTSAAEGRQAPEPSTPFSSSCGGGGFPSSLSRVEGGSVAR
uniref:Uncharacterized protein n=1 Tax=Pan troglodytes TaxID=9598 RepID=A0A2I3SR26_PANTR